MAEKFISLINIRQNNDYCHTAMLHGHDMKKQLMSKRVEVASDDFSQEEKDKQFTQAEQVVRQHLAGNNNEC